MSERAPRPGSSYLLALIHTKFTRFLTFRSSGHPLRLPPQYHNIYQDNKNCRPDLSLLQKKKRIRRGGKRARVVEGEKEGDEGERGREWRKEEVVGEKRIGGMDEGEKEG